MRNAIYSCYPLVDICLFSNFFTLFYGGQCRCRGGSTSDSLVSSKSFGRQNLVYSTFCSQSKFDSHHESGRSNRAVKQILIGQLLSDDWRVVDQLLCANTLEINKFFINFLFVKNSSISINIRFNLNFCQRSLRFLRDLIE